MNIEDVASLGERLGFAIEHIIPGPILRCFTIRGRPQRGSPYLYVNAPERADFVVELGHLAPAGLVDVDLEGTDLSAMTDLEVIELGPANDADADSDDESPFGPPLMDGNELRGDDRSSLG